MGHFLSNGSGVWSKTFSFKSSPYPGQDSLQRVIIFGDMGQVVLSTDIMKIMSAIASFLSRVCEIGAEEASERCHLLVSELEGK